MSERSQTRMYPLVKDNRDDRYQHFVNLFSKLSGTCRCSGREGSLKVMVNQIA